ncbi:hypothetical protein ACH33_00210 [Aneurinibacillus sp. XH2]|jgi:cobalt/nickel transport system permease protein|uniref:cobalt ECF transporter T component CbiQ n=1 Tax=Aneurinibacillus sp. XH2 TaxID=1450761 RepID=UPI00070FFD8B|nr:cobalt ECF transporter T component CbiQ [Aneurinibacillus sp. XH2]AMA71425.1 hypothetical protein ACH33_00210 [Aneurinibacillus sp. XH2]
MKIQLDTLAYTNRLRHVSPIQKLVIGITMLCFVMVAHAPTHIAVFVWMSVWIVGYAGIPWRIYLRLLGAISLFLALSLPPIMLEITARSIAEITEQTVFIYSFGVFHVYIGVAGMKKASALLLRSLSSVSCLYFILLTVPFTEILAVLRRIGVPCMVTDLLLVMYRFVFVFLETVEQLWIAYKARGARHGFSRKMRDAGGLVARLFARTVQRYQQLSIGLAARGFDGDLRVLASSHAFVSRRYAAEAAAVFLLLVALEWWTGR